MNAKDCCDILTQAGIRPTSTRILVYEAIAEEKNTFSLGDLEERLPSIDKSGLFRTLTLFHDHRLIHSVDDGSGSLKYCFCHAKKKNTAISIVRNAGRPIVWTRI